ncbi:MAG: CDP-diacylglycerol diphosphatase [Roseateles depolymerans]|uniref:CDP-diacylglycerol pyrophosphatase n=1 Tax=Roseateles depolymerans TaxID=76731 RepID=A0A2W5DIB5_9BURK|nr:MAG: CDP-diacylglycerol diphosphatase [Roseateles depolymerans]
MFAISPAPLSAKFLLRALSCLALSAACASAQADRNALWNLIEGRCVPHAQAGQAPEPCAQVQLQPDRDHGWVLLKDLKGPLQYLLMPSNQVPGVESPLLYRPDTPNYTEQAWQARSLLDRRNGRPLPHDVVSLTVNSKYRRSQDQLHIHISCTTRELRARLLAAQDEITAGWTPLSGGWLRHAWYVRRVDAATLARTNLFADAAAALPGSAGVAGDPGRLTVGVVGLQFKDAREGFVLMASAFDPQDRYSGSSEDDMQDHDCALLGPKVPEVAAAGR